MIDLLLAFFLMLAQAFAPEGAIMPQSVYPCQEDEYLGYSAEYPDHVSCVSTFEIVLKNQDAPIQ